MKENRKNSIISVKYLLIIIPGILLALNVALALANPRYITTVSHKLGDISKAISGNRSVVLNERMPALAQGGVPGINTQKAEEAMKDATAKKAAGQAAATKAGAAGKGRKKQKKPIDPETLKKALNYFQTSLLNRDVVLIGQTDKLVLGDKTIDKPYISTMLRDNPFDQVEEVNIRTGLNLNKVPPEPFYPPPGHSTISVSAEDFRKYIETLNLNGVLIIGNNSYALINAGSKKFFKKPGEDFKDKFTISVDDVNADAVLVSDEYGNKGLLELSFRKGYQVQPVEGALFITNLGQ